MTDRPRGLYEVLITEAIASQLRNLGDDLHASRTGVRPAEAPDRLALHLGRIVQRAIAGVDDADRVAVGVALARKLIEQIDKTISGSQAGPEAPIEPGTVLRAVLGRTPDGRVETMPEPLIPLLDTTLLTNAPGEPRVGNQLLTELHSADRIDLVMAFIRRSGIVPLLDTLRNHCQSGRELRVLTTTYTGSTEGRALDALSELGADVRVSYDMSTTRLHAKAWLFHRRSGFSTAYIGSSNLTYSAQISGLEWNVRVSGARNPDVIDKVGAVSQQTLYWKTSAQQCPRDGRRRSKNSAWSREATTPSRYSVSSTKRVSNPRTSTRGERPSLIFVRRRAFQSDPLALTKCSFDRLAPGCCTSTTFSESTHIEDGCRRVNLRI